MTVLTSDDASSGKLLPLLVAFFYIFFTLIPNSNSLMVQWPWVFFWQIGLLSPLIWLLWLVGQRKFQRLGQGWEGIIGIILLGLVVSAIFAQFPHQARWYSWSALGYAAALYALHYQLSISKNKHYILVFQGYLSLAFILVSLSLWTTQTFLPELMRLRTLQQAGINVTFDFSVNTLRNWVPLGHQNYVAGYLLLALPLFVGLSWIQRGWQRKLWIIGLILGLLNLYTTSSRGGWLGLLILCGWGVGVLLFCSRLPKLWIVLGGIGSVLSVLALALANNRLRTLILSIPQGKGEGELAYRYINGVIGWNMGKSHPFTGIGLGNVPQLYQKYRPFWAGRESEWAYQLHSTPVQLWAEMGIWGVLSLLASFLGLIWLIFQFVRLKEPDKSSFADSILFWCVTGGLLAYGAMSLTDYQLDNMAIMGTIVIYLVFLLSFFRYPPSYSPSPLIAMGGMGLMLAVLIWLFPIHRAWQLSSQGFTALRQEKIEAFSQFLGKAQTLVPWEPYYPYQLAWNLGNLVLDNPNLPEREARITESLNWFDKGNQASPYQEFGRSNQGWLFLAQNPSEATQAFKTALNLVPAKRGLMYGLGLSSLMEGNPDLALEALSLEALRDPSFITSPIWRSDTLKPIYQPLLQKIIERYDQLIAQDSTPETLKSYLMRCRGGVYWWKGEMAKAQQDWQNNGNKETELLLQLSQPQPPLTSSSSLGQAWLNPTQRSLLLQQGWKEATQTPLNPDLEEQFRQSMEKTDNFHQWLTQYTPVLRYRRERLGFGVNMRHIDGVIPQDFLVVLENAAITPWFSTVFPSPIYYPELDKALQPWRDKLMSVR